MQKEIEFEEKRIMYTVRKHKRAKQVRLRVYGDGRVVITLPWWVRGSVADRLMTEKASWILEKLNLLKPLKKRQTAREKNQEYKAYKEKARTLVLDRLAYFNQFYQFSFKRVSIRNQKTRWGSCSRNGNLSFNYRLAMLSPALADYVVVHELCHLGELNHSKQFWALVEKTVPDYRSRETELKRTNIHGG